MRSLLLRDRRTSGPMPLYIIVSVLCLVCLAPALAEETASRPSEKDVVDRLERLARQMKYMPTGLMGGFPLLRAIPGTLGTDIVDRQAAQDLRMVIEQANVLPESLLDARDATKRGLVAFVFGMSDSSTKMMAAFKLVADTEATKIAGLPYGTLMYGTPAHEEETVSLTVGGMVRLAMKYRLVGPNLLAADPFQSDAEAVRYWQSVQEPRALPSEWVFRARRAIAWGTDIGGMKQALITDVPPSDAGLVAAAVSAFVPSVYTDTEVIELLKKTDHVTLRRFLEGTLRRPGVTLKQGPNSTTQMEVREVVLRMLHQILKKDDAQWVYDAAGKDDLSSRYIVAAARLDPPKGVDWLRDAIEKDTDQLNRCILLQALWSVGGDAQLLFIKDRYFAEKKPEYNAGGLQENLIERLAKEEGAKAAPLLKALVLDRRFTTLGWAATRAFAKNAALILGEETKEVKRYLGVEHRMGVYDFEHRPEQREKYLVDTKHVLMQTEAFQIYLQGEVLKQREGDSDAK